MSSPGRISGWMPCCACGAVRLLQAAATFFGTLQAVHPGRSLRHMSEILCSIGHLLLGTTRANGSSAIAMEMRWRQDGSRVENKDTARMRDEQARGPMPALPTRRRGGSWDTGTFRRSALFGVWARLNMRSSRSCACSSRLCARSSHLCARSSHLCARWLLLCCCAGVATCGQKGPLAPPPDEARAGDSPSVAAAPRVAGAGAAGRKQTLA